MKKDTGQFMEEAIKLALQNVDSGLGGPFGALVVKDGEIVGKGVNTVTSSNDPTAHAEVNAIRDACRNLDDFQLTGCEIYTSCEPCPMCLGAIYWARPEKVYFAADKNDAARAGFDDSFIYREIQKRGNERQIPFERLDSEKALAPFQAWNDKTDKMQY